jgi:hypothetical protein
MPLSIPYSFTTATVIEAGDMNSNFTAVKNFADALATGVNIDSGAIIAAKIATGAVETAKIADSAVTAQKLDADVSQSDQFVLGAQVFG